MEYVLVPVKKKVQRVEEYLKDLSNKKLIHLYNKTKNWLLKHESKVDSQNMLDVSNQPYNPKEYESKLRLLEKVEDEGRRREITPFISEKELKKIFS